MRFGDIVFLLSHVSFHTILFFTVFGLLLFYKDIYYLVIFMIITIIIMLEHIGHVSKMLDSAYSDQQFKPGCISMLCP